MPKRKTKRKKKKSTKVSKIECSNCGHIVKYVKRAKGKEVEITCPNCGKVLIEGKRLKKKQILKKEKVEEKKEEKKKALPAQVVKPTKSKASSCINSFISFIFVMAILGVIVFVLVNHFGDGYDKNGDGYDWDYDYDYDLDSDYDTSTPNCKEKSGYIYCGYCESTKKCMYCEEGYQCQGDPCSLKCYKPGQTVTCPEKAGKVLCGYCKTTNKCIYCDAGQVCRGTDVCSAKCYSNGGTDSGGCLNCHCPQYSTCYSCGGTLCVYNLCTPHTWCCPGACDIYNCGCY